MMNKQYMSTLFGTKLRKLREVRGLTQRQVAGSLGYASNSYIGDVENGLFIPSSEKLKALASALGMPARLLEEIAVEARVEDLGIREPEFVSMFKDYPRLSRQDKRAIIAAYQEVKRRKNGSRHQ